MKFVYTFLFTLVSMASFAQHRVNYLAGTTQIADARGDLEADSSLTMPMDTIKVWDPNRGHLAFKVDSFYYWNIARKKWLSVGTLSSGNGSGGSIQQNSDWTALSGVTAILHKPTSLSQFLNDAGFVTSIAHTHGISDGNGTPQFTIGVGDNISFAGAGSVAVSYDAPNKRVTFTGTTGTGADGNNYTNGISYTNDILTETRNALGALTVTIPLSTKEGTITAPNLAKRYWTGYKTFAALNSDSINQGTTNLFMTSAERSKVALLSGTNTGDENQASLQVKLGQASAGTSGYLNQTDWNTFNNKASLASPVFSGTPTAPTALSGTSTLQLANTAFVSAALAGKQNSLTVGTASQYFKGDLSLGTFATDVQTLGDARYVNLSTVYTNPSFVGSLSAAKLSGSLGTSTIAASAASEGYVPKIVSGVVTWSPDQTGSGGGATLVQQVVNSGSTVSIGATTTWFIYDPNTTASSLTLTFPASPADGQTIDISFGGTLTSGTVVTSLTIAPAVGQAILQTSAPTTVQVETLRYRYRLADNSWYRFK